MKSMHRMSLVLCLAVMTTTISSSASAFVVPNKAATSSLSYRTSSDSAIFLVSSSSSQHQQEKEVLEFQKRTKELCDARNLKLNTVKNARDLASVAVSVPNTVQPNKIYRMGRVSDASQEDIHLLLNDLNIKTLVDLRSPTELKDDPTLSREEVFAKFTDVVWSEARMNSRKEPGCVRELSSGESPLHHRKRRRLLQSGSSKSSGDGGDQKSMSTLLVNECDVCDEGAVPADQFLELQYKANRKERHFVSLMNEFKYVKGTMSKVRKRDIARSLLKSPGAIVSKRVRVSCKKPFLDEINQGGLIMLNELLLRYGAPGIRYVLELCADPSRHPVAFYCTAGKDRTGMIAALILSLLGVPDEDIVQDYSLSANVYAEMDDHQAMVGALSQRNLDPKTFLGAPPHVMRDTLVTIREQYGSVEGYLDWIGFGPEKQKKLRDVLQLKQ